MAWFQFAREDSFPTHYGDQHSPAHIDVLTSGFIVAFLLLGISLFCILPAYNGNKRWIFFAQILLSLSVGGIVMLGNFGHNWEVGHVRITSAYKSGTGAEISGKLGLHIALRGINITLREGKPNGPHSAKELMNETIDYNEHFSWEWAQGRFGFGPYAGRFNRDYRKAVYRGLPIPILQLAEYFTFDGEGIRFGRHYKTAGYYAHIMMWLAFPTWLIANILFCVVVRYAATFLTATGVFQLIAIAVWTFVRNVIELQVPFEYGKHEVFLSTSFGSDYYLVFVNGIVCVLLGSGIFLLDMCIPDEMCNFFGIDPLTIYDEYHLTKDEIEDEKVRRSAGQKIHEPSSLMEQGHVTFIEPETSVDDEDTSETSRLVLKRRTIGSKLFQKSFTLKEKPHIKPRRIKAEMRGTPRVHQEQEMTARTPLLKSRAPPATSNDDETEDEFDGDYANFPLPKSKKSSGTEVQASVVSRH